MEFNMTEKDKRLLVFLAAFLIIVGFVVFGILPAVNQREELDTQIQEETATKQTMETTIASYSSFQTQYDALKKREETALDTYYPIMSSQEIDRKITGIVLKKNAESMDLKITMDNEKALDLEAYYASELALLETAQDTAESEGNTSTATTDTTASSDSGNGDTQKNNSTLSSANVVLTTQGTRKQLLSIINMFFMKRPEIHINSYSISDPSKDSQTAEDTNPVLTIDMDLYMCDKESVK